MYIEHDHPITKEMDPAFYHLLKMALLLALRERGILNATQFRQAAEKLNHD